MYRDKGLTVYAIDGLLAEVEILTRHERHAIQACGTEAKTQVARTLIEIGQEMLRLEAKIQHGGAK